MDKMDRKILFNWMERNIDMSSALENHMVNTLGWHYAILTAITEWISNNDNAKNDDLIMARKSYMMIKESKNKIFEH